MTKHITSALTIELLIMGLQQVIDFTIIYASIIGDASVCILIALRKGKQLSDSRNRI